MMAKERSIPEKLDRLVAFGLSVAVTLLSSASVAAQSQAPHEVTFAEDIAPILSENCVTCHRPGGGAPMSLTTYDEARRWAPRMKFKTAIRDRMGAMPPYYVERDIGIQGFKDDMRLTEEEIAAIAAWADADAPEGDPAATPLMPEFTDGWAIEPDLVVRSETIEVGANDPDWWGFIDDVPIPLEEDRYVKSVQVREVNDLPVAGTGRRTVGGRYIVHHASYRTVALEEARERERGQGWPVHEVGRNVDIFDDEAGRPLKAGSVLKPSIHLHSAGIDATGHLEWGFEFFPKGFEPKYTDVQTGLGLGDGVDIDIEGGGANQLLHTYRVLEDHTKIVAFEPHLHAPGERACLEAIWGSHQETLSCVGYDHNWVRKYTFADGTQPLLPKGTVLHMIGYMNNSDSNPNVADGRNWQGSGNRSVANMFLELGLQIKLTDEQFLEEMAQRREMLNLTKNDYVLGCPLCLAGIPTPGPKPSKPDNSGVVTGDQGAEPRDR